MFSSALASGIDTVSDFTVDDDVIWLDDATFTKQIFAGDDETCSSMIQAHDTGRAL